ncbi:uncharacterized protein N7515_005005 [Penicillium bovifimosum]|uniref:Rhodanese domain-containing protein n=1 Tax=Penicillium bovifimosum TaxID=126998 RepID=A0A9W9H172_9EURO|nr:uncharacterized protein N7515_005005 [Penicillium bovifimosum]KAJ5135727.1 hypothetical protein N7515_005005 [Penicillium bovifimosum]
MSANAPWHAAFPAPKSVAPSISREELLQWIRDGKQAGKDYVLVDLRRTDYEGGTIRGSLNLPAQSLYPTIPTLYSLVSNSSAKYVIWYCGSSAGRGTRAGGWFADYLEEKQDTEVKSLVLTGGIKGWVAAGSEYTSLMDGYDASVWTK